MGIDKEKIINGMGDLPTLPSIVQELRKKLVDPKASASDISNIVTNDVAISAKILRLVNSAFYGLERKVESIQHAVAYLGFRNIYNLVLNLTVFKVFSGKLGETGFKWNNFWLHCLATAEASRIIANEVRYKDPDAAFTAGLLHDLGKLVLGYKFPNEFEYIIQKANASKLSFSQAEAGLIEIDHAEIGFITASYWQLPQIIKAVIKHHHQLSSFERTWELISKDLIVDIIIIADVVVQKMGIGANGSFLVPEFPEPPVSRLGINKDIMLGIKEKLDGKKDQLNQILGLIA
ncbi:MAG: HDOD domain-containing protein [Oligoflexia bacterium]|nr:HDOD domain-containing protein [Oligoflexia bacterium]